MHVSLCGVARTAGTMTQVPSGSWKYPGLHRQLSLEVAAVIPGGVALLFGQLTHATDGRP